jgi:DNA-binding response OmpR family regulator
MKGHERILIVEDELPMRRALADCLESEGYRVLTAENGVTGLDRAVKENPDLILLDVMMPKLDGFAMCGELRRLEKRMPVLMLTAKGMVMDRVRGLDAGADDYLVKPFSTDELLARVRALLRRVSKPGESIDKLELDSVRIDFIQQRAWRGKTELHLTTKEFAALRLLGDSRGEPVSRQRFLDIVWGYAAFPTTRTVDNHIASLRSKVEKDPDNPKFIKTVHGIGYRLELPQITKP